MSEVKITQITPGGAVTSTDLFETVQDVGTTPLSASVTAQQLATFINGGTTPGPYVPIAGGVTLGSPIYTPVPSELGQDPVANQLVPFQSVQEQASYFGTKQFVFLATTDPLPIATYYNGPADDGVGATLTADTVGLLTIDGFFVETTVPFNRVLIKNELAPYTNGIYDVISDGSVTPFLLQRSSDFDNSPDGQIGNGILVYVFTGDINGQALAVLLTQTPVIVGTDNLLFNIDFGQPQIISGQISLSNGNNNVAYVNFNSNTLVTLTYHTISGTPGFLSWIGNNGVGFSINSTSSTDNSLVNFSIVDDNYITPFTRNYGIATLSNGIASVSSGLVSNNCVIILQIANPSGSTNARAVVSARNNSSSFTVSSGYGFDNSDVCWLIIDDSSFNQFGNATLSSGSVSVPLTSITSSSVILLTVDLALSSNSAVTNGYLWYTITPGTGFTIHSSYSGDNCVVGWVCYLTPTSPYSVTLTGSTTVVSDSNIDSDDVIFLSNINPQNTNGGIAVGTITSATSFEILSNRSTDASQITFITFPG